MYEIVKKWTQYLPPIYSQIPSYESLLYSYVIASAELGYRHQSISTFMASELYLYPKIKKAANQGWIYLDLVPDAHACPIASSIHNKTYLIDHNIKQSYYAMPNVLHYHQHYGLDYYTFDSILLPSTFFTCSSPLLAVPPMNISSYKSYFLPKGFEDSDDKPGKDLYNNKRGRFRHAFYLCALTSFLNEASLFYKNMFCKSEESKDTTVWSKSLMLRKESRSNRNKYIPEVDKLPENVVI